MKRKLFLFSLLFIPLVIQACTSNTPEPAEADIVHATISSNLSYLPLYMAEQEGFFEDNGIQIEFVTVNRSADSLALLLSNEVDVYAGTVYAGIINTISQMDGQIKVVADRGHISSGGCVYQAFLIRTDLYESGEVTGPADLAGLAISAPVSGPAAQFFSTYLNQGGLTYEDIELKTLDDQEEFVALENKAIAGCVAAEPYVSLLVESGNAVILIKSDDVLAYQQSGVIAFGPRLVKDDRELGVRFIASYLKAIQQYNEGKTERNLQLASEFTGETIESLQKMCWPSMSNDGSIDFPSVDSFQQWSAANDQLEFLVTEEEFWDPYFITAAQELLSR